MRLAVCFDQQIVGHLWLESGQYCFAYADDWQGFDISRSLPRSGFASEAVAAFFENLLPEGAALEQLSRRHRGSLFTVLQALGRDNAGALRLWPESDFPPPSGHYHLLTDRELTALIANLPQHPLAVDGEVRLSLAGAQPKLSLAKTPQGWALPQRGAPSSHIFKPPLPDLPDSVLNEAFCMRLAADYGLNVPESHIEAGCYVVQRYDRVASPKRLIRLHQEDFCQALGVPARRKYQSEGGPNLADCFGLLKDFLIPEKQQWLDAVIFNFLIGNHDAHAKNFSLLHQHGRWQLAPFYDLLSTCIYPHLSPNWAMKIGSQSALRYFSPLDWQRMAKSLGLTWPYLRSRLQHAQQTLPKLWRQTAAHWEADQPTLQKIGAVIEARARKLGSNP
jgi:serine/threonine-protein kinase HipA